MEVRCRQKEKRPRGRECRKSARRWQSHCVTYRREKGSNKGSAREGAEREDTMPSLANGLRCPDALITRTLNPLLNGPKFAVIYCGNHQYKVAVGDVIAVQRLRVEIGSHIALKKVLMVGAPRFTAIGRPLLEGVRVTAQVEEQKRMRNVVSLFATPGRRHVRWVDAPHAATIIRICEIFYSPNVVGELDKYKGELLETFTPGQHTNPVYPVDDGYDVFRKKDKEAMENATTFLDLLGGV